MQKYKSNITTTSGAAVRNVPVHVLAEDGSPASIFLDRAGTVQAANPLSTASDGTFYFYAENGRYSLRTTVDGVTITDADVALLWDPAEVLLSGPLAEAVERAEASAAQADAAVADSGIVDLVASAQNAVVDAKLALAEASGFGQSAQEAKDAAASAVLASQVATDAANLAVDAAQDAILASAATIKAYATHAEAAIAAALLPDGADVEISQDETRAAARTRYKVQAGALVFVVNLDQVRLDLASPPGASLVGFQQEGTGAVSTTVQSKLREFVSVKDFGAVGDGATDDTAAIQKAIDEVHAAGGGEVFVPTGTYSLSASSSSDTWEVYAAGGVVTTLGPSACCLILRRGVYLVGAGIGRTKLAMPSNTQLDGIYVEHSPEGYGISGLKLDGGWDRVSELNSHGILWVTKTIADEANTLFTNGVVRDVAVENVGAYGFGLQAGTLINNLFDNIRVTWSGADGLDAKNHNNANRGNRINGAVISAHGLRTSLLAQAGIDLRGEGWVVSGARVTAFGRADTQNYGIRLNASDATNGDGATRSSVSNFYISATDPNTVGVSSCGANNNIGSGTISGCTVGVWLKYSKADSTAIDNTVTGVEVDGGGISGNGFSTQTAVLRSAFIGCTASNISTGFRPAGTNDNLVGCSIGAGVTIGLSKSGAPVNLVVTSSPTLLEESRAPSFLSGGPFSVADDSVVFVSTGSQTYQQFGLIGQASAGSGFPNGLFMFRSSASPQCTSIAVQSSTNVIFTTGVLTGTTGVDGNFTVASTNGGLYFENRTGSTKSFVLTFFGER